jgi:hypothetical protein
VPDNRPGSGRELGGTEVMEAKRGKLKSGVHPLWLHKAVDGGGTSYERSGGDGEVVGVAKWRRPWFKRGRHGRLTGGPQWFQIFFSIYPKLVQL